MKVHLHVISELQTIQGKQQIAQVSREVKFTFIKKWKNKIRWSYKDFIDSFNLIWYGIFLYGCMYAANSVISYLKKT